MSDLIQDPIFLFEKTAWLRWVIAGFFFLLGVCVGWWKWRNKQVVAKKETRKPLKLSACEEATAEPESVSDELATSEFGPIYHSKPDEFDDLQKIKGIGKALRAKLYSIGIFKFEQIANWSESEVAAVSKKLHLTNQIGSDEWQDQAKTQNADKT